MYESLHRQKKKENKRILESTSPMTASVAFQNRAMIVECLVVTVLVEDVGGCLCTDVRTACARNKEQRSFCC